MGYDTLIENEPMTIKIFSLFLIERGEETL